MLSLEDMEMSPVRAALEDYVDVQGLCGSGPTPHWLQHSGERSHLSPIAAVLRTAGLVHSGAGPGGRSVGELTLHLSAIGVVLAQS